MSIKTLTAALFVLFGTAAMGSDGRDQSWEHKDWWAARSGKTCLVGTGGDGDGTFRISISSGGFDAQTIYQPAWARGLPRPVGPGDVYEVFVDGNRLPYGPDMESYEGLDEDDWPFFRVGLVDGLTPDLIDDLRAGNRIAIQVTRPGQPPRLYDEFSLSGFTANFLKIADWCKFNPDELFRS